MDAVVAASWLLLQNPVLAFVVTLLLHLAHVLLLQTLVRA